jgi:phosphopantetheinyl transferase
METLLPPKSDSLAPTVDSPKVFNSRSYSGAWFPYSGDRMALRGRIQDFLQMKLNDPSGQLKVGEKGPEWHGTKGIQLSYSHSGSYAILVWTSTHRIGVDLETSNREYSHPPLELATRFFHATEVQKLSNLKQSPSMLASAFLDLWLKKEAYAKLTRLGLKDSIHSELDSIQNVLFETLPVIPAGYDARVAIETQT